MKKIRYLTKSRFKLGIECPTKLFYTNKKEYPNQKLDDSFLAALAEGGYQVGELAKCYFPGGHDITSLDYEEAERQTQDLLKNENVIIFEPAIRFKNLFIRIDVLVKNGNHFELIEVKAKSYDKDEEESFLNKNGTVKAEWKEYLYDIAFQKYVLQSAFPDSTISSHLMLVDKNATCPVDGLNQKFKIVRSNNRKGIEVSNTLSKEDLQQKILIQVSVDDEISLIYDGKDSKDSREKSFFEEIEFLANNYEADMKIQSDIGSKCAHCEFKCSADEEKQSFKSGFKECWSESLGWSSEDFEEKNVLEIWNFRGKEKLISEGKIKFSDVSEADINPRDDRKPGISASERQWLQVELALKGQTEPFFDFEGLKLVMKKWKYPLHFIDFETTAVAIPFHKGRKPYEGVAFQFSHHIVHENGTVEHEGQFLNTEKGFFPNYDFLRSLKGQLENDSGTILRYAPHENTYLNLIYRQLIQDPSPIPDRSELCDFIKLITKSVGSSSEKWEGSRNMVDLWELVKRYYYNPRTNGSNSIKYVLPAILNSSKYLQDKYSKPIYGASGGIKSLNFKDWQWIEIVNGEVVDPYKKLPKLFKDVSDKNIELLSEENELANGGAALTAYGKIQFSEISDYEKRELEQALLKYCELDTLAMVMIFEAWREMIREQLGEERLTG